MLTRKAYATAATSQTVTKHTAANINRTKITKVKN